MKKADIYLVDNSDVERVSKIGIIDFGYDIGKCKILIYNFEDDTVPHFHIEGISKRFKCCVCIYDNMYFTHGEYKDTFDNSKQCKFLNEWLKKKCKLYHSAGKSNWEYIKELWENYKLDDTLFPENRKTKFQPDYSTIRPYRKEVYGNIEKSPSYYYSRD